MLFGGYMFGFVSFEGEEDEVEGVVEGKSG